MRLRLDERWGRHLRALPECGMGYQRVDVALRSGEIFRDIMVFNGEELELPVDAGPIHLKDIKEIDLRH